MSLLFSLPFVHCSLCAHIFSLAQNSRTAEEHEEAQARTTSIYPNKKKILKKKKSWVRCSKSLFRKSEKSVQYINTCVWTYVVLSRTGNGKCGRERKAVVLYILSGPKGFQQLQQREREREREKKKGIYYSILSYSRLLVSFGFLFRFTSLLVLLLFFLFSLPAEKVRWRLKLKLRLKLKFFFYWNSNWNFKFKSQLQNWRIFIS